MMIYAYREFYLNDAKQNLAECFDYAINACHFDAELFSKSFVQSRFADKFERGNPAIVAGMSGIELVKNNFLCLSELEISRKDIFKESLLLQSSQCTV